jgi:hypothetical protein
LEIFSDHSQECSMKPVVERAALLIGVSISAVAQLAFKLPSQLALEDLLQRVAPQ